MLIDNDSLYLYNLTLKQPSLTKRSVVGQFTGTKKSQELVLASSTSIEVYKPNAETGKVEKQTLQNVFGILQQIGKIRIQGTQKDLLVITSDSGKLVVAEYNEKLSKFIPLIQEPHSKNGLRRLTPGDYLCVDPQNRAILVGAIERNKLIYKVEMSNKTGVPELSSPLEVASKNTLTLTMCSMDTNYENPLWAALEIDYANYDDKTYKPESSPLLFNYYELDQGLNHVVQKKSKPVPSSANLLIPLPGHIGGVLICCTSFLIYEKGASSARTYLPLPIREHSSETVIVNYFVHTLKKNDFFILLQSSIGDLFKVTVDYDVKKEVINDLSVTYFDSIPVCNGINVLKSGFLFANTADNNKLFYQFEKLGEEDETTLNSTEQLPELLHKPFQPQGLQNLALVDIMETLSPLVDATLLEATSTEYPDPIKQLVTLSSHSYMKTLTYGLPTSVLVSSPLPMVPSSIFTTKLLSTSMSDEYLVLSSPLNSQTLVLSIGEVVEEVADSGFVVDQPTIEVQQVGKHSIVQVHSNGIRHIRNSVDENGEVTSKKLTDWFPPAGITILRASANQEQVIIGLSNREICYFEIDSSDDQLIEYQERFEVEGGVITALAITKFNAGGSTRKSDLAVVGTSDETIQVLSLHPHNCFEILSLQALSSNSHSLLMLPMDSDTLFVHIGMSNGVYVRALVDGITGKLSDTRLKYLGSKPVELRTLALPNLALSGVLAISSRPWIGFFNNENNFKLTPLIGSNIQSGTSFYSEDIGTESVVGIKNGELYIFTVGGEESGAFNVNNEFMTSLVKLRYTPRKHLKDRSGNWFYVIESENNVVSPYTNGNEIDEQYIDAFGYERKLNLWASCIQVVDVEESSVLQTLELENNECAMSMCQIKLLDDEFLIVGTTENQTFAPPSFTSNYLHTYQIRRQKGKFISLLLLHKTKIDGQPSSLTAFNGKLLVGMANQLRLYEMGQKQLLRKSSTKVDYLRRVNKVEHLGGDMIVVGDSSESISFMRYDSTRNLFTPSASDVMKRQITTFEMLDNKTVIGGDKFGNVFVSRLSSDVADQIEGNVMLSYQDEFLGASGSRLNKLCDFYLQDIPTSFHKGTFVVGGTESIIYTGLQGTVGLLLPLATKQEVELLMKLEQLLRKHYDEAFEDIDKSKHGHNLLGKEHLKFRSYYNPVKNVIDGDFVERFYELPQAIKIRLAGELDRTPRELERKIYDLRNRAAF